MPEGPIDPQDLPTGIEGRLQMRNLSMGELVTRILDDIRYQRRMGLPWGPSVDYLRTVLVGLEDPEFWDGMPPRIRKQVQELEKSEDASDRRQARRQRKQFLPRGWNGLQIRAVPGPDGRPRYRPTPDDLDAMLMVLLRLLARRKMTWKTRELSPLPDVRADEEADGDD